MFYNIEIFYDIFGLYLIMNLSYVFKAGVVDDWEIKLQVKLNITKKDSTREILTSFFRLIIESI